MRMVVEVEAELTGRTLAEFEAELMGQLRRQLGPVVAKAVTEVGGAGAGGAVRELRGPPGEAGAGPAPGGGAVRSGGAAAEPRQVS